MKRARLGARVGLACVLALAGCGDDDGIDSSPDASVGPLDGSSGGGGGGNGGGNAVASDLRVTGFNAREIANGSTYEQETLNGVPPYSDAIATIRVVNRSRAPLTVHRVTLTPLGETEPIEWRLNEPNNTFLHPITIENETLEPDAGFEFGLFFYPLASGPRNVRVDIEHGAGSTFSFTVAGRGRDNATYSPDLTTTFEHLLARSNLANSNSLEVGGIVADPEGNVFINANVSGWNDAFGDNLVLARVGRDGELSWVRELQEPYPQWSPDIGNNDEIGGGPDSLAVDAAGDVYLAFERSLSSSGATDHCLVMQVDATTGDLGWARALNLATTESAGIAARVLRCQAVDASLDDRVLVAGQVADSAGAFLFALSKADGSLLWARTFVVGGVHRVGTLVVDATNGRAYLGGIASNAPFAARFDGVAGSSPSIAWSRTYTLGAANVHGLALDGDGLLAAIDVRGATTHFTVARLAVADGRVVWSKTWDPEGGPRYRALSVTMHQGQAVFSGRCGFEPFDVLGDGFLLALDPATGAYGWGAYYYGGKGAEEIMNTSTTALVSTADGLWALHYQVPGANNHHHFWGRWYQANDATLDFPAGDGAMRLVDAGLMAAAPGSTTLTNADTARAHVASITESEWADVTTVVEFEDPVVAEEAGFRAGTQALLQRLDVTP